LISFETEDKDKDKGKEEVILAPRLRVTLSLPLSVSGLVFVTRVPAKAEVGHNVRRAPVEALEFPIIE
jgi:hypothetical protein